MAKNTTAEIAQLRQRVSALNDRVMVLENRLQKTQEMMQKDVNRLVEAMRTRA